MTFTHIKNKKINMVDISKKNQNHRHARAVGFLKFNSGTFEKVLKNDGPKGEIFNTARIAAIIAAKKTGDLIPLCHNINLNSVKIEFKNNPKNYSIEVYSDVKSNTQTGVEMEALTACSIACLTIYDMCKSFDKKIIIEKIKLIYKDGGKSGKYKDDTI
ncbi:MAG: cyclic pyranopterin monophosphate synthase MoaC [Alphaproteobacteria bacterium]